ncbi:hypothetical protein [Propionivibrio sp.]|uniref:hypothetical protein n=1 Tax=Propionivibrio sp. TaxID=2212460 RepID=UPI003BF2DE77
MGAMLAALLTVWHTMEQREREKDLLFIGNQFRVALNHYYQNNQHYPARLENLVQDDDKVAVRRYLRKIFFDPMTRQTDWGTVKLQDGQIVGVYSLSEAEPLKKKGFRMRDIIFEGKNKYSEWLFMAEGQLSASSVIPDNSPPAI